MVLRRNIEGLQRLTVASCLFLVAFISVIYAGSGPAVTRTGDSETSFTVSGMDNIWGAGLTTAPDPGGNGGGVVPVQVALPAGTATVTFSDVEGSVYFDADESNGPDGGRWPKTNISSYGGISGLRDKNHYFYMVGVFLDGGQPASPPPTLNFTKDHRFQSLAPDLGQVFFVGDGLTGHGKGGVQDFEAPPGSTALYLGFADAPEAKGPPGAFGDNGGTLTGNVDFGVLAPSATTTTPASSSIVIGKANSDNAVVSGNATYGSPTGTVTFYECGPTASPEPCTSQANPVGSPVGVTAGANDTSSASSVSFTPSSAGYWCFAGYYSGDTNYAGSSDTTTDECFDVTTGTAPSATTTTPASSSIEMGNANSDNAVVSGNATYGSPTGTVTFYECGPTASPEPCTSQANQVGSPVGVTAGANDTSSASSVSFTPNSGGYWCFAGFYSGDSNYAESSDTTTDECFDVTGPSISNVQVSNNVNAPTVTISGSGFGTVSNLGSGESACGSSPTGLDYGNNFLFADHTDGWNAGEGSPDYDCIGVIIQSYSNTEIVFTFGSDYGVYPIGSGVALLNSGDQFTMTLLGASFSGTAEYTTGASTRTSRSAIA